MLFSLPRVNVNDIVDLHERMEIKSDDSALKPELEEPELSIDPGNTIHLKL